MARGCKIKKGSSFLPLNLGVLNTIFSFFHILTFISSSTPRTSVTIYMSMSNTYSPDCFSDLQNQKFRYLTLPVT